MAGPKPKAERKPGGFWRFVRGLFLIGFIIGFVLPVGLTVFYRFVPPPITILMVQRMFEGRGLEREWRPIGQISPSLTRAVIGQFYGDIGRYPYGPRPLDEVRDFAV